MKRLLYLILLLMVSFSGIGQGTLNLSWNPSTDNVGVAGYVVWVDGERYDSTEVTQYEFHFEAGVFQLTVSAYDAAGNESAQSTPLQVTVPDVTVPDVPQLLAVNYLETAATVFWQESGDNMGVAGYNVWVDDVFIGSTSTNEYKIENMIPDKEYRFSVSAYDNAGNESQRTSEFLIKIPVDKLTMKVYPNPVKHGRFNVLLENGEIKNNSRIQVIAIDGKILVERNLEDGLTAPYEEEFDLSSVLTSGLYVVVLYVGNTRALYSYLTVTNAPTYTTKYVPEEDNINPNFKQEDIIKSWRPEK